MEPYERPLVVYDKTSRDPTLMKRRDFIKTSMVISAFGTRLPLMAVGRKQRQLGRTSQWESDRIVILIKLNGGNDGLNTVIPIQDDIYYQDGVLRIVSDKVSSIYLDGLTIDFSDDLIEPGFRLSNKNAKGSCGGGSSFSTGDAPNVETGFSV